jgi:hypothetical protein
MQAMTKEVLEQIYNSYLSAYSIPDPEERARVLRHCVTDEIASVLPYEESRGLDELSHHIEQFQKKRWGSHFRSKILAVHHSQFLAELTLHGEDDQLLATAQTYGRFNERGLLTYLIGFFF